MIIAKLAVGVAVGEMLKDPPWQTLFLFQGGQGERWSARQDDLCVAYIYESYSVDCMGKKRKRQRKSGNCNIPIGFPGRGRSDILLCSFPSLRFRLIQSTSHDEVIMMMKLL